MATRIGVMSQGKILQVGKPAEVYETPNCNFVADFIGIINSFQGTLEVDERDHVIVRTPECRHYVNHGITGVEGMTLTVAVRPEKMSIGTEPPGPDDLESPEQAGFNHTEGVIEDLAYLGSLTTYHVRLDSGAKVQVTYTNAARHDRSHLSWGSRVHVWWCGSDVVVLTQ